MEAQVSSRLKILIDTLKLYYLLAKIAINSFIFRSNTKNSDSFLLMAPSLPPDTGSGTHRPTSLLRYAPEASVQINAISNARWCEPSAAGDYLLSTIPTHTAISRISESPLTPAWRLTPKVDGDVRNLISMFFLGKTIYGSTPPSVIISSSPPFYIAVAAYLLSRHLRSIFVMDYRDEWTRCPFDFVSSSRLDKLLETHLLRNADLVLYTTETQKRNQMLAFPNHTRNTIVLPNGWEEGDVEPSQESSPASSNGGKIVLSFVGNLVAHSSPHKFLRMLAQMIRDNPVIEENILVQFIGRKDIKNSVTLDEFEYGNCVRSVDNLPKPEALRQMKLSDALLIFSEPDLAAYRPGKLYDYLATKRPVIVFGSPGEASDVVSDLRAGWHLDYTDSQAFLKIVEALKAKNIPDGCNSEELDNWLSQHTRRNLALRLYDRVKQTLVSKHTSA